VASCFTGFTQEEVDELCDKYRMDRQLVREWYNGYKLRTPEDKVYEIYSPKSLPHQVKSTLTSLHQNLTGLRDLLGFKKNITFAA